MGRYLVRFHPLLTDIKPLSKYFPSKNILAYSAGAFMMVKKV